MRTGEGALGVLLVEDDAGDARLLRQTLPAGALTGQVTSLADAVTWLDDHVVDVVLLDLGLPDSTGLATLQCILEAHPRTPVVVLSGHDDDDQAKATVEAGAQEYLVKGSVDAQVMRRTLRHAVERHRLQADLRERAKEVAGLYAVTRELQVEQELDQLVAALATHLRTAMESPEDCHVEVTIDRATATAGPPSSDGANTLVALITPSREPRGRLTVSHVEGRPFLLPHEQELLDAAAEAIEVWLGRHDAVRTLQLSEERLRMLVSQLPGLVWTADTDLLITSYNGALLAELDDLDIAPEALVGLPLAGMLGADTAAETLARLHDALAGRPSVFEREWHGRWWRNHVEPKRDADGEVVGIVCLSLDVTAEKAREAELTEIRARLQGLFDNASDAIILADDSGRYLDANPAACELTGYAHDELVGLQPWDLAADEDDPDASRGLWQEFLAAGSMAGEYPLLRRDGSTVDTEFRAVTDVVSGVHLSVMRDVTYRKQAEAALSASEERFRTMAEAAQDAIYRLRTEPEPAFEYLNSAVATISGFCVEDFHANPMLYLERAHPEDVHLLDPARLGSGATETVTLRFRHAADHWVWLEDSRTPIIEDGRTVGVQGVIRDVTSRRRTQQALEDALEAERQATEQLRSADQLKSHFLQAVSHELRTPLTAVLGLSATMVEHVDRLGRGEVTHLQQRVLVNAQKLDCLLTDLLDLERLQHGVVSVERQQTDLTALVTRVARDIEFDGRSLSVDDVPAVASVDPDRVERIVHNLLANAVKHTRPGTRITVRCAADQEAATIEVADDGPGIPDDLSIAIFEPFRQSPRSYGEASPGTGIGLSIVREFAALHGGAAWVHETPGGGATFTVRLPATHEQHRPTAGPPPATRRRVPPTSVRSRTALATAARTLTATADPHGTDGADGADGAAVVAWATRELLDVTSKEQIVRVILRAVHQLGGWTVPARVADEGHALPLDISLGTSEPLLPAAEPASVERLLLERHLPQLIADARQAADTIAQSTGLARDARRNGHRPRTRSALDLALQRDS